MGFTDPNYWKQSPPPQTGDMNNERYLNQKAILELPGAQAPQELTIADGRISPTRSAVIVDTEGGGAADDLDVINTAVGSSTETLHPGMLITIKAKDPARVVTVKNSAAANGINTADGNDIVLSPDWELTLRLVGGRWYEVPGRASAQAASAQSDATEALARTNPATTTSRGIGRVATAADLVDGATITNGPAFLAAEVHTSVAAAAGKIPVADADGSLNSWAGARYAACSTAAATAAKAADLANFQLVKGSSVFVTFANANTATGALTLNVNGTGAKAIYNEQGATSASNFGVIPAGLPIEFVYDGTNWRYKTCDIGDVILQVIAYETGALATCSTAIPVDDIIPQSSEGTQVLAATITPKSATSRLRIDVCVHVGVTSTGVWAAALFQGSNANAIAAMTGTVQGTWTDRIVFSHVIASPGLAPVTFAVRIGSPAATLYLNGSGAARLMGGVMSSSLIITEIAA